MDEFRYILGLILVIIMPIVITFWLVIHMGAGYWRGGPPARAYRIAGVCILLVLSLCFYGRSLLVGSDLGMYWPLFLLGSLIYLLSWGLWKPIKRHLDFKTFAGLPEVKNEKIALITDGPFSMVRHPRYLMVSIGIIGWCLMSHHAGAYLMGIASIAALVLIVSLEERDLIVRFGEEYRSYQRNVPMLVPTWSGIKKFWAENRQKSKPGNRSR